MRRQETLVTADQLDIADAGTSGAAHIGTIELVASGIAVGGVAAVNVRHNRGNIPVGIRAVADTEIEIAIDGLAFDFLAATGIVDCCCLRWQYCT